MSIGKRFFLLLCVSVSGPYVYAQLAITKGLLSTNSMAEITIQGDLSNTGSVTHRGRLAVSGNFVNRQRFFEDGSSLLLNGETQTIETIDQSMGTLIVNGSGQKRLIGNLSIQNSLQLEQGIVAPEGILQLAATATVNGGSSTSYVDGFLYHQGTGTKFYPVGREGTYAPATLLNVTGTDPVVGIAYFSTAAIDGTPFHWQVQPLSGTYRGSRAELTFSAPNADYAAYRDEVMVLGAERSGANFTSLGQSTLGMQGNRFTISSDQPSALPVLTVGFDIPTDTRNLYLPNAFSASAPSPEDQVVKVYGQRISPNNFYLAIQDVWGNVVYETRSWQEASTTGWRGPLGTAEVATTYRYLLKGKFTGGKRFQQSGTILHY